MNKNSIVAGISGLVLAGVLATGAFAEGSLQRAPKHGRHVRAFVHALQLSDAQKGEALEVARDAQPIVRELRQRVRAERDQGREHVQELRRAAFQRILPEVRALAATLTPEQRARLEERAKQHGRTFDEARFERRLAFVLSRPGAAERIQRHLRRGPKTR